MIGAPAAGAEELLDAGELLGLGDDGVAGDDGLAGVVVDDGALAPVPAEALCWVALAQAQSAAVSASPVSAALRWIRFSMTAPPAGKRMPLGRGIPVAWFPSVAAWLQKARLMPPPRRAWIRPLPNGAGRTCGCTR
jgi:hypothetical protein